MAMLYTWYPQTDGTLTRRGRNGLSQTPDDFELGVTQPTPSNTGAGIIRPYPTTVINSNVTVASGQKLSDTIVNGYVTITGTGTIENCVVRGPATTESAIGRNLIDTSAASWVSQPNISFCTIEPQAPSPFLNGVGQRNFYIYRSSVTNNTDNMMIAGDPNNNYRSHTKAEGNYIGYCVFWIPDIATTSSANPGGRPEGSHCEAIQFHGNGNGIGSDDSYWYGNTINGDTNTTFSGTCTRAGVGTAVCDPSTFTRNMSNGVTLTTPGAATQCNAHFERNWFDGGYVSFNGGGGEGANQANGTMKVVDNYFKRRNTGSGFPVTRELVININYYVRIVTPPNHFIDNPTGAETVSIGNG